MIAPVNETQRKPLQFLFDYVRQQMGFVPNSMQLMGRVPAILGSFGTLAASIIGNPKTVKPLVALKISWKNLGWMAGHMKNTERVPLYLKNLVGFASSQAAGCRYCQVHTISEAIHNETPKEKLENIWSYDTHPAFTDAERAALRFGFAAGSVPNQVTDVHFNALRQYFSEENIVELGATVALFGFLNRWNDTFATQLEAEPLRAARQYLEKGGWSAGKHLKNE